MKTKVCASCGYIGKPVHDEWSSFLLDLMAWLFAFVIAAITGIIPLVLAGPAFSIYHLVVFRSRKCPKCGDLEMVSMESSTGKHMLEPHVGGPQPWTDDHSTVH